MFLYDKESLLEDALTSPANFFNDTNVHNEPYSDEDYQGQYRQAPIPTLVKIHEFPIPSRLSALFKDE